MVAVDVTTIRILGATIEPSFSFSRELTPAAVRRPLLGRIVRAK
jgi:hypothetical protein